MRHQFKSVSRSVVYTVESRPATDKHDYYMSPRSYVHEHVFEYETYGDGMTPHSPTYLTSANNTDDFMISFLHYVKSIRHSDDLEPMFSACRLVWHSQFDSTFSKEKWEFFSKLRYNENKTQYFNEREMKVSTRDKLCYDKRWERVDERHNGSFHSLVNSVCPIHYSFLEFCVLTSEIAKWYQDNCRWISIPEVVTDMKHFERFCRVCSHANLAANSLEMVKRSLEYLED